MENGHDWTVAEKFSGLTVSAADPIPSSTPTATPNNQDSSLIQVMKAMEAAEATIKQQVEENIRMRNQLEHKILELHRYKLHESMAAQLPPSASGSQDQAHQVVAPGVDNRIERIATHGSTQHSRGDYENGLMPLTESNNPNSSLVEKVWDRIVPGLASQFDSTCSIPAIAPRPFVDFKWC